MNNLQEMAQQKVVVKNDAWSNWLSPIRFMETSEGAMSSGLDDATRRASVEKEAKRQLDEVQDEDAPSPTRARHAAPSGTTRISLNEDQQETKRHQVGSIMAFSTTIKPVRERR